MIRHRIGPFEAVGLRASAQTLRQCWKGVAGDRFTPPTRFDASSLRLVRPWLGPATWLGRTRADRRAPVASYVNRTPVALDGPYDVRTSQARDYRGGRRSYNAHDGTDLVVPVGTHVVAPAAGVVVRVENLMHRGGLKVMIDHGRGLVTISNHLARASVAAGDVVPRGAPIGLSGFSSVDGILFFPWVPPHVHFMVLLDGEVVDPFAAEGEVSLWRHHNAPRGVAVVGSEPSPGSAGLEDSSVPLDEADAWVDDELDEDAVDDGVASCRDPTLRDALDATVDLRARAFALLSARTFDGPRFTRRAPIYAAQHARAPRLDLPFDAREVTGLAD